MVLPSPLLFKEQRQIEGKNVFLNSHVSHYKASNGHASSLREIITYCVPTYLLYSEREVYFMYPNTLNTKIY